MTEQIIADPVETVPPAPEETALERAIRAVGATALEDASTGERTELEGSAVPPAARSKLKDRLRKREVKKALAVLDEDTVILVIGLKSGQMDDIREGSTDPETGEAIDPAKQKISKSQAQMFRLMCFDPETREPVFEDWTDEEFEEFPLGDAATIMEAISKVNGKTTTPGKGSPSTGADEPSSE